MICVPYSPAIERWNNWLRGEVAPAYDAWKADPSRARTTDAVRATLKTARKKSSAKA